MANRGAAHTAIDVPGRGLVPDRSGTEQEAGRDVCRGGDRGAAPRDVVRPRSEIDVHAREDDALERRLRAPMRSASSRPDSSRNRATAAAVALTRAARRPGRVPRLRRDAPVGAWA